MAKPLINIPARQASFYAAFLVLYEFLTYIANDMIMPGMLKVVNAFHGPESAIATSLTLYVLGGASLQLFLGPVSDRYGRRPLMIFGALLFFICTVVIACSNSMTQFLLARFFQGMGLCFIAVIGYATLQEIFAEMDAIRLIALMANIAILAPLVGPLLGALIIYYSSWRLIFVLVGILALLALWGLWKFMPEPVGQMKSDGSQIKRIPLSVKTVAENYKKILLNRPFMLGSISLGIMYLPCMAWIALSPVMLVNSAHLSIIDYGIWQIPVFASYISGNIFLHKMTHHGTVKKLILLGSYIVVFSLLFTYLFPVLIGSYFIWLMPGLIIYFFGAGVVSAPLARFILFSTNVGKGTASALMSMVSMCVQAIGIELANYCYATHNNQYFGLYCLLASLIYCVSLFGCLYKHKE